MCRSLLTDYDFALLTKARSRRIEYILGSVKGNPALPPLVPLLTYSRKLDAAIAYHKVL